MRQTRYSYHADCNYTDNHRDDAVAGGYTEKLEIVQGVRKLIVVPAEMVGLSFSYTAC